MAHPVRPDEYLEINNFYTATVYEKGAEVIRMQHTLLGPERFRRGMDLYFERHDGQAVTCDDFVQAMQDAIAASDLDAVPALVQPGRHAGRHACAARYDAAARDLHARRRAAHAGHAGPAAKAAVPHSARRRPRRPGRPRPAAARSTARRRRRATTRVLDRARARGRRFVFAGSCRPAGAVAAARLLGAGARSSSTTPTRSSRSSPRTTATRSTAGTPRSAASCDAILALARGARARRAAARCRRRSRALVGDARSPTAPAIRRCSRSR